MQSPGVSANAAEVLAGLPERIGHVIHRHALERREHPALADAAETFSYGELAAIVADVAARVRDQGVRPGDRMMIVSENSLPLAALVLAASELGAWAVVANPRLPAREIDQICDHCEPRRVFDVTEISDAAQGHAIRHGAFAEQVGPLGTLGIGPIGTAAIPEPVEASGARNELARAIEEDGVSILFGVPATYQCLLEYKATTGQHSLSCGRLRLIGAAGAPLDLSPNSRIEAEWGLPLLNGYGITECAPGISSVRAASPRADNGVGQPIPGVEVRVVDRDGRRVAPGDIGELHARGPGVMRGYYKEPDLTAVAIDAEGWFNTGDLARSHDGSLFIVSRTKEMTIRSGFNVYPAEVEAVLNAHPAVIQSAVVGRAVEGNEEVIAFAEPLPGTTTSVAEPMEHAQVQLAAYMRPAEIVILDAFPVSSTGKILKHKLAQAASGAIAT